MREQKRNYGDFKAKQKDNSKNLADIKLKWENYNRNKQDTKAKQQIGTDETQQAANSATGAVQQTETTEKIKTKMATHRNACTVI